MQASKVHVPLEFNVYVFLKPNNLSKYVGRRILI